MKPLTLCLVVLLATVASVICQEEQSPTTTLPTPTETETKPPVTTEVPTPVETSTTVINPSSEEPKTESPTEVKPSEEEAPKDEPKEGEKAPEEPKNDQEQPAEPKEEGEQESLPPLPPQQLPPPVEQGPPPTRVIFVQQTIRDPITGMIYTRQVPLIPTNNFGRPFPPTEGRRGMEGGMPPLPPPEARPPPQPQPPQESFDPLGQFSASQKKRQFFQDMLLAQLSKFETEVEPLVDREENVTEKNDIEDLLGRVAELKHSLEGHQIFNISEIMNNWKQGKLQGGGGGAESAPQPQRPPMPQLLPPNYGQQRPRNPPLTLRTLILVPNTRLMQQGQQQHQQQQQGQFNPYQTRQIPVIHIRRGMNPFQQYEPTEQQQPKQSEQLEPQPMMQSGGGEEYANTNEIFGY